MERMLITSIFKKHNSIRYYYNNKGGHRNHDLPATVYSNPSYYCWWKKDLFHRENNLPSSIAYNGSKEYTQKGYYYRINKYSFIDEDGYRR